ncbi:MAG: leucine-rich repeat protein [Lachnospiraceae bacterium]|nr:leucine-rich repeat protein [Lachnospiraceae bacterium]
MKKIYLFLFSFLLFLLPSNSLQAAEEPTLSKSEIRIGIGESAKIKLRKTSSKVTWSTNKKRFLKIKNPKKENKTTSSCVITGKKVAEIEKVYLIATVGEKQYKCRVYIETRFTNDKNVTISKGNQRQLLIETKCPVKWSSNKKSIATVTSKGLVEGKKAGTARITALIGNQKVYFTVKVKNKIASKDKYQYKVSNGQARITKYIGDDDIVEIPKKLGGAPVTRIAALAFGNDKEEVYVKNVPMITKVTMPNTITRIDQSAFSQCQYLTDVRLSSSLKTIGTLAFENTKSLEKLMIPDSVTKIQFGAFRSSGLVSISIPDKVTKLSSNLFGWCESLEKVSLPNSIKEIGTSVFYMNPSLKEIVIPEGVVKIEDENFLWCEKLEKIVLPSTLTQIGKDVVLFTDSPINDVSALNAVIYAPEGSYAAQFAQDNNIKLVTR